MEEYKGYEIEDTRDRESWNLIECVTASKRENNVLVDFIKIECGYCDESSLNDEITKIKLLIDNRTIDDEIIFLYKLCHTSAYFENNNCILQFVSESENAYKNNNLSLAIDKIYSAGKIYLEQNGDYTNRKYKVICAIESRLKDKLITIKQ